MWNWVSINVEKSPDEYVYNNSFNLTTSESVIYPMPINIYYNDLEINNTLKEFTTKSYFKPKYSILVDGSLGVGVNEVGIDFQKKIVIVPFLPSLPYIKNVVRGLISSEVYKEGYFAIHSSIVQLEDLNCTAIIGPSGSGKTHISNQLLSIFKGENLIGDWALLKKKSDKIIGFDLNFKNKLKHKTGLTIKNVILLDNEFNNQKVQFVNFFSFITKSNKYIPVNEDSRFNEVAKEFWREVYSSLNCYFLNTEKHDESITKDFLIKIHN